MEILNFKGIIIGAAAFLIIQFLTWLVIKGEYLFSKRFWYVFLIMGIATITISLFAENIIISSICSIFGFASLWGIGETIEQEKRVRDGRFPINPKRKREKEKEILRR